MDLLVTASIPSLTGLPRDTVMNSFAIRTDGPWDPATDLLEISGPISDFYTDPAPDGSGISVSSYFAPSLNRAANMCRLRFYELGDLGMRPGSADAKNPNGKPYAVGSPIAEDTFTIDAASNPTPLPTQVAAVLTLRGRDALDLPVEGPDNGDQDTRPNRPRQRSTGRLYLGPLNAAAQAVEGGTNSPQVASGFISTVLNAANELQAELNAAGHIWSVWSRTNGVFRGITRVEVDNRFDTIRKRLAGPTVRTGLTFSPVPSLALGA